MVLRQKYIGEYEITAGVAVEILQYEEYIQEILFDMLPEVGHPGFNLYDSWAFSIDDKLFLELKTFGESDDSFTVYSIEDINDIDVFLDYINMKKAIKWDMDMMTLKRL